jgi:SSS family solute:Na+ symporter
LPSICIFFIAFAILGAAITGFNAGLTSSSALFVMNIYQPYFVKKYKTELVDEQQIKVAKRFQIIVAIIAMCIAPCIYLVKGGFYNYLQMVGSIFSVPIFTVIFVGFVTKSTPALAAKVGLVFFVTTYVLLQFFFHTGIHYLHLLAILFVLTVGLMLLLGKLFPRETPFVLIDKQRVNIQPWRTRYFYYALLLTAMMLIYFLFSPLGLAK